MNQILHLFLCFAHLNNDYKYIKVILLNNVTCSYKYGMVDSFEYCKHLRQQMKLVLT